jgi:hypothetical protein
MCRYLLRQRVGGAGLIEPYRLVLERGQVGDEVGGIPYVRDLFEAVTRFVAELGRFDIEPRPSLAWNGGEAEDQRRMGNVRSPDIEGPGQVLRIGDDQDVGA